MCHPSLFMSVVWNLLKPLPVLCVYFCFLNSSASPLDPCCCTVKDICYICHTWLVQGSYPVAVPEFGQMLIFSFEWIKICTIPKYASGSHTYVLVSHLVLDSQKNCQLSRNTAIFSNSSSLDWVWVFTSSPSMSWICNVSEFGSKAYFKSIAILFCCNIK